MEEDNLQSTLEQDIPQADQPPVVPVPQEKPPPITQEESNKSLKIFLSVLIPIALLALVVLGLWFYQEKIAKKPTLPAIPAATPTLFPPTPTPVPESTIPADWKTYIDPSNEYRFYHPSSFELGKLGDSMPLLNHRIYWGTSDYSYKDCRGDCPMTTSEEALIIDGQPATKIKGWVGSVGGNIPQSFIEYEIQYPNASKYFIITLWELIQDGDWEQMAQLYPDDREIKDIPKEDEEIFDQILSTFKFLDENVGRGIQQLVITDKVLREMSTDPYTIKDLRVKDSILEIDVSYGGGCKQHEIDLYWDGRLLESLPPQADFYLIHNSNNDACEMWISEKLRFNISKIGLNSESNEVIINLYDFATKERYPKQASFFASSSR